MHFEDAIRNGRRVVVGIGSALVDILAHETDEFIQRIDAIKGGMKLVNKENIENALPLLSKTPEIVSGGSACNTVSGVGRLGGAARFVGKCGNGAMGARFRQGLADARVDAHLINTDTPTGRVLSVITPDAQRSMLTFLGAAADMMPEEITEDCFHGAAVVHIEGYLLYNEALIFKALEQAKQSGAAISLDLASFNVVNDSRETLARIVRDYVDIVIANEDEAEAFTGIADEAEAAKNLADQAPLAVVKAGKNGSYIATGDRVTHVDAMGDGTAVDTTGAGDLWAAGFLYGLVNGYSLEAAGALGSACGYEVCQVVGATIPEDGWHRIRKHILK